MDTFSKGDAFEQRVFDVINEAVQSERLGILPSSCRVYRKKGYHSRDRDADIIVDISIEVWLPNANNWSILWVWECKDYSSQVPVSDVEEFWAKLQQIAGVNVKGGLATTCALQSGALSVARAKGIAVVRVLPDDQVDWLLYLMTVHQVDALNPREFRGALTSPGFRGKNRSFYGINDGYIFGGWSSLLKRGLS